MNHCHSSHRISISKLIYKKLLKRERKKKATAIASCIDFFYTKQRDSPSYMIYHNHLICLTSLKKEQWILEKLLTCKNIMIWQHFCCFHGLLSLSNMTCVLSTEKLPLMLFPGACTKFKATNTWELLHCSEGKDKTFFFSTPQFNILDIHNSTIYITWIWTFFFLPIVFLYRDSTTVNLLPSISL